jgi:hypothetical protein
MGLLDSIADFMRGSRKRSRGKRKRAGAKRKVCQCHAYPFPHAAGGGKCKSSHADGARMRARYFGKKARKGKPSHAPYFKQAGKSSPFHECVSQRMYSGEGLATASRRCSKQRKAQKSHHADGMRHAAKRRKRADH